MTERIIALSIIAYVWICVLDQEIPQQMSLHVAKLGDDVNLTCVKNNAEFSYWYKLNFGYMLETVAIGTYGKISLSGQFNNSRFNATKVGHVHSLIIRNVNKEDEATYLCHAGSVYETEFINGTILAVKDPKTQLKSVTVKQTPDMESVHLGDTMTLQCSLLSKNENDTDQCPDEDKVHWFKGGSESHPGVIYHGSLRNKEDGRCDYSLSKTITNSSDAGTYYCAVVTCSEILFGEGTKRSVSPKGLCILAVHIVICIYITLHVQLQTMTMFCVFNINCKTVLKWLLNSNSVFCLLISVNNLQDGEEVGVNYAALDFPSRKAKKWKNKWELPDDSIYSGMIDYQ
uniref:Ig-like domain-containing protein n=1 Tax=Haplochromis burtoni TaxID=8153 RepID=A0A3Q2VXA9_HAPBU